MPDCGTQLCEDCKAPLKEHVQGHCPHEVETGEKAVYSQFTDTWYVAYKWLDKGDGRLVTLSKKEISEERAQEMKANE